MVLNSFSLSKIGQIMIPVHDQARAVQFYRNTLGMKFLFEFPGLAFFDCGGVRLLLEPVKDEKDAGPADGIIYYQVDGIEQAYDTLVSRGARFEDQPHIVHRTETTELWMAFFRDSEGNLFALMEEQAKNA